MCCKGLTLFTELFYSIYEEDAQQSLLSGGPVPKRYVLEAQYQRGTFCECSLFCEFSVLRIRSAVKSVFGLL